ncbi:MAG: glutamate mutase L, partial [Actinomycetota bacterium]|nr:glutamate mutase L [Actinomycetota bacterium]
VRLVVGSGGVLRYAPASSAAAILEPARTDLAGGWRVPERAELAVDAHYVLAAAGLLAATSREAAARLLAGCLQQVAVRKPGRS